MRSKSELPEMIAFETKSALVRVLEFSLGEAGAKECERRILHKYGTLSTALSENEEELCRVCGISMNNALLIKLLAYVNSRRVIDSFRYGEDHTELEIRELLSALFLGASLEEIYLISLDGQGRITSVEYIGEGTVNASDVFPRKLLECALKKKAKGVILAHNHPKGNTSPSKDDLFVTGKMFNVFASAGIRLCAHYIVGDGKVGKIESDMFYNPDFHG